MGRYLNVVSLRETRTQRGDHSTEAFTVIERVNRVDRVAVQ